MTVASVFIVYILFYLVFGAILGFLCSYIAGTKNRDKVGYFFLGFFLGIIGLIVAAAVPKLKEDEVSGAIDYYPIEHKTPDGSNRPLFIGTSLDIHFDTYGYGYISVGITENRALVLIENDEVQLQTDIANIDLRKSRGSEYSTEEIVPGDQGQEHLYSVEGSPIIFRPLPIDWITAPNDDDFILEINIVSKDESGAIFLSYGSDEEAEKLLEEDMDLLLGMKSNPSTVIVEDVEPSKDGNEELGVESNVDTKECPFCAETIKAKAIKCKHCGSTLDGTQ